MWSQLAGRRQIQQLLGRDRAFLDQHVQVQQALPVVAAEQHDGHRLGLLALHQRDHLEQLVQRAEATREGHQGLGAHHEVHLAQREVVELEAQLGRDEAVGRLLVRQRDVQADVERAFVVRPGLAASMMPGPPPVQMNSWSWRGQRAL
jgi:hypothetical protein